MSRSPEGPPPPPTVQRLRVRYAKRDRLRFSSHRDFARAFERALRRAGVPIAFSAGFSPHPKVSYANAAPTGVASEAEYLEIGLAERREPDEVRRALDAALPPGLDVLEVVEAAAGALADRLEASVWRIQLDGLDRETVAAGLAKFLASDLVEVERMTKNGLRRFDARAAVASAETLDVDPLVSGSAHQDEPCAIIKLVVRHVTPAVRPDDVLSGLRRVADLTPPHPPRVTRLAQGPLGAAAGEVYDPLAVDRSGEGSIEVPRPDRVAGPAC
ncbi:MAG TPA: TIGR03936 family radical SAM-associated protein [Sporichthyaceae bacterium]|nr:TIGR03936 family radical SAM-associated protein [Sporichthyaceae bacterium]